MKKYRVYISQINQTYYDVVAANRDNAIDRASRMWKMENDPEVMSVSVIEKAYVEARKEG